MSNVDQSTLTYDTYGSGFPLLLLHGALVSRAMWEPQLEAFSRSYQVIVCDLPAHGSSADVTGDYSITEVGRQVMNLLNKLRIDRLHLCGHSLGGMVAQHLAATHPKHIGKLVLAETAFGTRNSFAERLQTAVARPFLKLTPQRTLVALSAKRYGSLNQEVASFIEREMSAYDHRTSFRVMSAAFGYAGKAALADIEAPTLVLMAGENKQTHIQGEQLARLIPDAGLVIVPHAHHLLNVDNPEFFNRAILSFLQS